MAWLLAVVAVVALFALGLLGSWRSRRTQAWIDQQTARLERWAGKLPEPLAKFLQLSLQSLRGAGEVASRSGRKTRRAAKDKLGKS